MPAIIIGNLGGKNKPLVEMNTSWDVFYHGKMERTAAVTVWRDLWLHGKLKIDPIPTVFEGQYKALQGK